MRKSGKMVRQSDITRYVYSCLMHNPSDEPQPLGELELARKFGTTRLTIQRALATFERDGRLIRIPGRRGLFTNPAVAKAMGDYYFFGVMTAERRNRFLDSGTQAVISGFVDKMQDVSSDYHYLEIKSESTADTVEEILNCGLDGLLWCSPAEQDIPVIEELTRRRFPVAAVAPPHKSRFPLPAWPDVSGMPDAAEQHTSEAKDLLLTLSVLRWLRRSGVMSLHIIVQCLTAGFRGFARYWRTVRIVWLPTGRFFPVLRSSAGLHRS